MTKVKNKKIIKKIAARSFTTSKVRNCVAVIAIVLTTLLFTSLLTLGIGINDSFIYNNLRQSGGDGHAAFKYMTLQQYEDIKDDPLIRKISFNRIASDSVDNPEFLKRRVEMYQMDEVAREMGFCENTQGENPKQEYDINMDSRSLELLGVEKKIGAKVTLTYTIKDQQYTSDFVLTGWWEADSLMPVGMAVVSPAFMEAREEILQNTEQENGQLSGVINSYALFRNTMDLEGKMVKVLKDNGYEPAAGSLMGDSPEDTEGDTDKKIACNVNWAYVSGDFFSNPTSIAAILAGALLIGLTGYLIIFNIFQISILKDIKFYGLLKTIGTTRRQIKSMIRSQALRLCCLGIPLGLLAGCVVGSVCLPVIMESMQGYSGSRLRLNVWIFAGAALFSIITVLISTGKPGKMAASVSPVEAVRYTPVSASRKKGKNTTDGGKIWRMALSNLARNKKRTILSLISMSLSLVILLAVFTLSRGFDMDKFVSKFCKFDFQAAHALYFQYNYSGSTDEDVTSSAMMQAISEQRSFKEGGRTLLNRGILTTVFDEDAPPVNALGYAQDRQQDGSYVANLMGQDDAVMDKMQIIDGEMDLEKMKTGDYLLMGVNTDDYGDPLPASEKLFAVGEKVVLKIGDQEKEFEILAKATINSFTDTGRWYSEYTFFLPAEVYTQLTGSSQTAFYSFDVKDGMEQEMDDFMKTYTETVEGEMDYTGKTTYTSQFLTIKNTVLLIGGGLSVIIGLIGILNFVNSMITSIVSRGRELAMLQAIGMTHKQLKKMLMLEGVYYAVGTLIIGAGLGSLVSLTVLRVVIGQMWFFTYQFVIWPLFAVWMIILLLGLAVPVVTERSVKRQSVVERLRAAEQG